MVSLSKTNKSKSLQQKYKVAQKVKQHHRDVKKSLKNTKPKKELPVEMKIQMEVPYREKIFQDIKKSNLMDKEAEKRRMAALSILKKTPQIDEFKESKSKLIKDSSRAFIGDIRKLIEESDIILMVLDARDPMGTRSLESEKLIKAANKTIIFILNKIDLVPVENMESWLAYLSKEARTFTFKANCQKQAKRLGSAKGFKPSSDLSASGASFGVDNLVNYLKSMNKKSSSVAGKTADKLVIGVAGVPNTGKSSVINSLKRKRICEAGNLAGLTRNLQHVALDNHIMLVDSPGIILAQAKNPAEYALRNCLRVEKIEDPTAVAEAIFHRCQRAQLQSLYNLPEFDDLTGFLLAFATRFCLLKKGGVLDLNLASLKLINDWNKGKIAYCNEPPARDISLEMTADEVEAISRITFNTSKEYSTISVLPDSLAMQTDEIQVPGVDMDHE